MKALLACLIFLNPLTTFAQCVGIAGGLCQNAFFDFQQDEGHYRSDYSAGYGYSVRLGVENIKADWLTMRFTLSYDQYGGELSATDGGLGGGYTTNATVDKSVVSLGIFPINLKIAQRISLNIGFELAGLVNERVSGTRSGWSVSQPGGWSEELAYDRYSAKTYYGLSGRIAYDFSLSDRLAISPQYAYYFGLSNEFDEFPEATRSMRHYFCLGLQRTIK